MVPAQGDTGKEAESVRARQGFALTLAVLGTLLAVTLCAQLPVGWTPSWLGSQRATYAQIWPQSWNFFASQPDSVSISVYRLGQGGQLSTPVLESQTSAANLWGLGRASALQFDEALLLAHEIPAKAWTVCTDERSAVCLVKAPVVHLQNEFIPEIVCGNLVFVRTPPAEAAAKSVSTAVARVACL